MKNLLKNVMFTTIVCAMVSCSVEPLETETLTQDNQDVVASTQCSGEMPKSRLTNNSNVPVNFEIYDEHGTLIDSAYNISSGSDSGWKVFSVGEKSFRVTTATSNKIITIDMGSCMQYDVAIDSENQLDTDRATQL